MGIVRGDRIAESRSLNARSIEVQEFYAALVAKVPDDFGRFRAVPSHVAIALYPRRELTRALLQRTKRMLDNLSAELPGDGAPLFDTWVCDNVTFGQFRKWKPRGNRYHRTPEPPSSDHVHSLTCYPTAIARARDWMSPQEARRLSLEMRELRERKRSETRTELPPEGVPEVHSPSPPSPSSPSSVVVERPPAPANPLVSGRRPELESECMRLVREIAILTGEDGGDVMARGSHWLGSTIGRNLNPAKMSDDRLLNTVLDLRAELARRTGKAPPDIEKPDRSPPTNPRAAERKAGMVALIRGGLRGNEGVGGGDAGPGRELSESGPGPGGPGEAGRDLPPGARESER